MATLGLGMVIAPFARTECEYKNALANVSAAFTYMDVGIWFLSTFNPFHSVFKFKKRDFKIGNAQNIWQIYEEKDRTKNEYDNRPYKP